MSKVWNQLEGVLTVRLSEQITSRTVNADKRLEIVVIILFGSYFRLDCHSR